MSEGSYIKRSSRGGQYTVVPNSVLGDLRLPLDTLGLLVRILRHPDGWIVRQNQLIAEARKSGLVIGREGMRRMMRQLVAAGYASQGRVRGQDGKWGWQTEISEIPEAAEPPGAQPPVAGTPV